MRYTLTCIAAVLAAVASTGCATFGLDMPHRVSCTVAGDECSAGRKIGQFQVSSDIDERDAKDIRAGMKALAAQRAASAAAAAAPASPASAAK